MKNVSDWSCRHAVDKVTFRITTERAIQTDENKVNSDCKKFDVFKERGQVL